MQLTSFTIQVHQVESACSLLIMLFFNYIFAISVESKFLNCKHFSRWCISISLYTCIINAYPINPALNSPLKFCLWDYSLQSTYTKLINSTQHRTKSFTIPSNAHALCTCKCSKLIAVNFLTFKMELIQKYIYRITYL